MDSIIFYCTYTVQRGPHVSLGGMRAEAVNLFGYSVEKRLGMWLEEVRREMKGTGKFALGEVEVIDPIGFKNYKKSLKPKGKK